MSVLSCISVMLLFVVFQADNGGEFHGAASSAKEAANANLTVGEIIQELAQLWPGCRMVKGAPYHSATNGGVERFNRTIQDKIRMWMLHNSSGHWSMGARGMCIVFVVTINQRSFLILIE